MIPVCDLAVVKSQQMAHVAGRGHDLARHDLLAMLVDVGRQRAAIVGVVERIVGWWRVVNSMGIVIIHEQKERLGAQAGPVGIQPVKGHRIEVGGHFRRHQPLVMVETLGHTKLLIEEEVVDEADRAVATVS